MNETSTLNAEQLAENIAHVRNQITHAAEKVGRDPAEVILVAVSKMKPVELVEMAYNLGVRDFGENRVQEALLKIASFHPQEMHWHLIGHLQSNKASKVVEPFASVQSVDSLHLAQILHRHAEEHGKRLPILLQINVAGESTKEGMSIEETFNLAREIATLSALRIEGLMTVAPLVENPEEVRPVFRALYQLRERLKNEVTVSDWRHLSMGMTDDYQVAIEEGATIVRVGRAIFGRRPN
ncbi:MAG TPA: YggS family pyridoxal phosphate-dependent enzyme [Ktedonobacteraceae bacterium]|nr:YggS family pyridoxal phosphate-dependent enzyme [Ktedonobacteraceae bacterium]